MVVLELFNVLQLLQIVTFVSFVSGWKNDGNVHNIAYTKNYSCPRGWHSHVWKYFCYYISDVNDRKTWTEAAQECIRQKSSLVYFRYDYEPILITNYSDAFKIANHYWIGLVDRSHSSESRQFWTWIDGSHYDSLKQQNIVIWESIPSGVKLNGSKCASYGRILSYDFGKLRDFDCTTKLPYVCRKPFKRVLDDSVEQVDWYCGVGQCCYATLKRKLYSYWQAQLACRIIHSNARLPIFSNSTEWDDFVHYRNDIDQIGQKRSAWLGYNDAEIEGEWLTNEGQIPQFLNWTLKGPDRFDAAQDCVITGWDKSDEWRDDFCTRQHQTVCQMCTTTHLQRLEAYNEKSIQLRSDSTRHTTTTVLAFLLALTMLSCVTLIWRRLRRYRNSKV